MASGLARPRITKRAHLYRALDIALWITLALYVFWNVISLLGTPVSQFDDAIPLVDGVLVQHGLKPSVDFYSFYPPLQAYANAGLFTLLGKSIAVARIVPGALFVVLAGLIARHFRRTAAASPFVPLVTLVFCSSIGKAISLPVFPGFAIALIAFLLHRRHPLSAGLLAAVATLFRVNFGGYVLAAVFLSLIVDWRKEVKRLWFFIGGFVLGVTAICLGIFHSQTIAATRQFVITAQRLMALRGFIDLRLTADIAWTVSFPVAYFLFNSIREPSRIQPRRTAILLALLFAMPLITVLIGRSVTVVLPIVLVEYALVVALNLSMDRERTLSLEVPSLLFFCGLLHYFLSRADWMHWRLLPIGAVLVICCVATRHSISLSHYWPMFVGLLYLAFILVSSDSVTPRLTDAKAGAHLLIQLVANPHLNDAREILDESVPGPGWMSVYSDQDERNALRFVRSHTRPSDPVFVGVSDTSRVFWNDVLAYWLLDRPIGVRDFQLESRIATEKPVQDRIIVDLQRNKVKWIILDTSAPPGDPQYFREGYHGSAVLDEYVRTNFGTERIFGSYSVLRRH